MNFPTLEQRQRAAAEREKTKGKAKRRRRPFLIPGIPEDVAKQLTDPEDRSHLTETGNAWLLLALKNLGFLK